MRVIGLTLLAVFFDGATCNSQEEQQVYGRASDGESPTTTPAPDESSLVSSSSTSAIPVTTTAGTEIPEEHWIPDRPDPYVCEYLGLNGCWAPSYPVGGPPYMGPEDGWPERSKTCIIPAGGDPDGDDAPAILQAFEECKEDGHVVFEDTNYYIGSVMNTTGLKNVDVEIKGTLLWSDDIDYWLNNSLPVGFQNQSSAWYLGGHALHVYGGGTLDGNGQVWYDYNAGRSNLKGRPHAITFSEMTESVISGLRFIRSQMWSMTVARSERVLLEDIYINNTAESGEESRAAVNTDGCDTVYVDNITFLRWTVDNSDDGITMKQNSTNIYIADSTFYTGLALAMGSIGQYPGQIEVIENVTAENIVCHNTGFAGRIKTWTGLEKGYPPNGGGGGIGRVQNITFTNFTLDQVGIPWYITQGTSYNGEPGGEDTSALEISDLNWGDARGTVTGEYLGADNKLGVASFQCSGKAPCRGVRVFDTDVTNEGVKVEEYFCSNVGAVDFNCTGVASPEGPT